MRRTLRHVLALFGVAVIALVIPVRPASGAVPEAFQTPQPGPRVVEISPDNGATVGVGMGQVNRVDAARLAVERGGDRVRGAVAASDAFFPFPDGLETLTNAGVKAIVHPGGSVRDDEVTAAAAAAGITLYLTGARHFAH